MFTIFYIHCEAAMSMPIPPPAVALPHSWASRALDGHVDGQSSDHEGVSQAVSYPPSRPPVSASTFSVTMPCALAWKEKTGIEFLDERIVMWISVLMCPYLFPYQSVPFSLLPFSFCLVCSRTPFFLFLSSLHLQFNLYCNIHWFIF